MRVVSLCPSNTDIVCALGLEHLLVGIDRWSLSDSALAKRVAAKAGPVADVGTDLQADIDAIVSLKPDIVLASLSVPGMDRNVAALDDHNLPYIIVDGHTLAGVSRGILQVAEALRASEAGRSLVDDLDAEIDAVRAKVAAARSHAAEGRSSMVEAPSNAAVGRSDTPAAEPTTGVQPGSAARRFDATAAKPQAEKQPSVAGSSARHSKGGARTGNSGAEPLPARAVWEWWPNPVIVAGRNSWIQEFFDILGVENVFADVDKESTPVDSHEVPERAPDTICVCWCGTLEPRMTVQKVVQRPGWTDVPAVRARRVFLLPEKLFGRPGPHLAAGLRELYELFYGQRDAAARRMATKARLSDDALAY